MALATSLKEFLLSALRNDLRLDGRRPFDVRRFSIRFGREDGAAEVQLGETYIFCVVSCQLVQPFPDQPSEGILVVHTEFSPMADPTFEAGRPGESAVELSRIIDRALRESRAIDMESLCVVSGKAVWSIRVNICVLDNGGNLIDAATFAALAALLSFRRPECSIGGAEGCEVVIHPPEIREPLPLVIHYLPVAFTFGFFGDGEFVVLDPSYKEELLIKGRLTIILNVHGDICMIHKGGGVGVTYDDIKRCLQVASMKVSEITASLKEAAEAYEVERVQRKIRRRIVLIKAYDVPVNDNTQKQNAMLENDILGSDVSISNDSDSDESDNLEEKLEKGSGRVIKPATPSRGLWHDSRGFSSQKAWDEAHNPMSRNSLYLLPSGISEGAHKFFGRKDDQLQQVSSLLDVQCNALFQKMEGVRIKSSGDAERKDSPAVKGRAISLLDAIKWNNVKKKNMGGRAS